MINKQDYILAAGLGIEFTVVMCACFFGGRWLDKYFGTSPWLLLAGCALAFALGLYRIVIAAKKAVAKTEQGK